MKFFLVILFFFFTDSGIGQKPYSINDEVKGVIFSTILNSPINQGSLTKLKNQITILDFFGTWCVPCIKALPKLASLQNKFSDRLSILLISTEEKERLIKFISKQSNFSFPVIADANNVVSNLFQPPFFPYTVVLNNQNKIIAITDAGSITEKNITDWMNGKTMTGTGSLSPTNKNKPINNTMNSKKRSDNRLVALSQDFMYAAKTGDAVADFVEKLKKLSYKELNNGLKNDDEKKAFWINAYNGYIQALLRKNPDAYKQRGTFFKAKQIDLAGKKFSLDDIEHGILRRSKVKWSLGYFNKWFPGKTEKQLRVDKLDYRLHFALNCGAKSCPPIAFYDPSNINTQLDIATTAYLSGEVEYNAEKNTLGLPAIMSWFRRDFGGKKKMVQLVKQKGLIPEKANPKIYFNKYDWELHLNNFQ